MNEKCILNNMKINIKKLTLNNTLYIKIGHNDDMSTIIYIRIYTF